MNNPNEVNLAPAPLKDRMVVYVGVAVILIISWLYILGMGWHMNTLPFVENNSMNMNMNMDMGKPMDMDKPMNMDKPMDMPINSNMGLIDTMLKWMPPSNGIWVLNDFLLLFLMWAVMMIAMMTPSILPMLFLFTTLNARNKSNGKPTSSTLILLSGYLFSWVLFSLFITFPEYAMHQSGLQNYVHKIMMTQLLSHN